jgi:hypothetical protein
MAYDEYLPSSTLHVGWNIAYMMLLQTNLDIYCIFFFSCDLSAELKTRLHMHNTQGASK